MLVVRTVNTSIDEGRVALAELGVDKAPFPARGTQCRRGGQPELLTDRSYGQYPIRRKTRGAT